MNYIKACFVSIFILLSPAYSDDNYNVASIKFEGLKRLDKKVPEAHVASKVGTVSKQQITSDIKSLYETDYFEKVDADVEGDSLVFRLKERPVVRKLFVKGNKDISESDIADVVKLGEYKFYNKAKITRLCEGVKDLYQSKGFVDATCQVSSNELKEGPVDLVFTVVEGTRYKITDISFEGLNETEAEDLISAMQTKTYKWYSSWLLGTGRLKLPEAKNDSQIIRQYLLDKGFVEATVSEPEVIKEDKSIKLKYTVHEGKKYTFGTITASGDLVSNSVKETLSGISSKTGSLFEASKFRSDIQTIGDKFSDVGYAFVNVVPNTKINQAAATVDLEFQISKGKPVKIDTIQIRGNEKTYDNVIRRELVIDEQETFSSKKIKRSEALLKRLGYFEEVSITTQPKKDRDDAVDLLVNVKDASTGTISAGAGWSTQDAAIFNARLTENNILGTGRKLDLNLDVGSQRNNASIDLTDRRFLDSYFSTGVEGFLSTRLFDEFDREMAGGGVSMGYPLEQLFGETFNDISTSVKYQAFNVNIKDVQDDAPSLAKGSAGNSSVSLIEPGLTRNTIDNPLMPTKGSQQGISYELAGLGGDEDYTVLELKNQFYQPLVNLGFGDLILSNRTRLGLGDGKGNSKRDPEFQDKLPLFRRYFPGGINSVRGFEPRALGPKEPVDKEYGGAKQFINNFEVLFPLVNSAGLRGLLFYDIGQAFDDGESIEFSKMRKSYGFGIRWNTPMGPIRLEFGFPTDRQPGEKAMEPMFSFGVPF